MSIKVQCSCGRSFEVPDTFAGRSGKCGGCGSAVAVPAFPVEPLPASLATDSERETATPEATGQANEVEPACLKFAWQGANVFIGLTWVCAFVVSCLVIFQPTIESLAVVLAVILGAGLITVLLASIQVLVLGVRNLRLIRSKLESLERGQGVSANP